jgi:hypothetical protein
MISTTITPEYLESLILDVKYHHENEKVTVCFITLKNSFKVIETSGVVNSEDFIKEIGERLAYKEAFNKLWAFEGYRLQWLRHDAKDSPFLD